MPVLVHDGHPVYESKDQIAYICSDKFRGPDLLPPEKQQPSTAAGGAILQDLYALTKIIPGDCDRATMGNCVPGLTLPIFIAMVQDIPITEIMWGLKNHPNKERPMAFLLMRVMGAGTLSLPFFCHWTRMSRLTMRWHLKILEDRIFSDGRKFLLGDKFCLSDVGLMPVFERMRVCQWSHLWEDLPLVSAYWERLRKRPSYKKAIKDEELPCIGKGQYRLKQWKQQKEWFKATLDSDEDILYCALRRYQPLWLYVGFGILVWLVILRWFGWV